MIIKRLWLKKDRKVYQQWSELLAKNDLVQDEQVDWTVGIFEENQLVATGSLYKNIVKCVAVLSTARGENLLTELFKQLKEVLTEREYQHLFLYTKPEVKAIFASLGFKEIVQTNQVVFMEQGFPDFEEYLISLEKIKRPTKQNAAIVMNANPFTKGHLHLVSEAAKQNETVYVFVVSEDSSFFTAETRFNLVQKGVGHLTNVVVLPTREYMVSSATFPSYFLKEQAQLEISKVQATLDATLFKEKIAKTLDITTRFVGEEPFSRVTDSYNQTMKTIFSPNIKLIVIPRKKAKNEVISATRVRKLIEKEQFIEIEQLVPKTTYQELLKMKNKQ